MCCSKAGVGEKSSCFPSVCLSCQCMCPCAAIFTGSSTCVYRDMQVCKDSCKHVLDERKELEDTEKYNLHSINLKFHS